MKEDNPDISAIPWWRGGPLLLDRRRIEIPGLAFSLKILHLSDLHFSEGDESLLRELDSVLGPVRKEPDLVTIAGDFINEDGGIPLVGKMASLLPAGVPRVAVLGNHDFHNISFAHGVFSLLTNTRVLLPVKPLNTNRLREVLAENKVLLLEHSSCELSLKTGKVGVTGLRQPQDQKEHGPLPAQEPAATDDGRPRLRILLTHRPDVTPEMAAPFDLVLGGHTHGGQIRLPGLGALRTNCRVPCPFASGRFRIGRGQWFVNNGFGSNRLTKPRISVPRQISLLSVVPGDIPPLPELRLYPPIKGWIRYAG